MDPMLISIAILVGYLMGSLSFARLVTRWASPGEDVTKLQVGVAGTDEQVAVGVDWLGPLVTVPVGFLLGVLVLRNLFVAYVAWLWLMVP
jgi:hypothetical protein